MTSTSGATRKADPTTFQWSLPETFNFATDVIDRWAADGDPEALIWTNAAGERRDFRFSDISRLSRNLAAGLREAGIGKGDRIVVILPRVPEWQIVLAAALRIGAIPIPSIEMLTAREIAYRIEHSGAAAVVCRAEHADKIVDGLAGVGLLFSVGRRNGWRDVAELMETDRSCEPAVVAAEDGAIMYYTSGSTGYPKGVLHAARGLFAWGTSARYWLDLGPQDRIWCTADTGWSKAGTSILFGPWSQGACAFFYDGPFDPEKRLALLQDFQVTVYCASATELARLLRKNIGAYDLSKLRRTVSAGEAVNPAIASGWEAETGLKVAEAFGQTETLMTALSLSGAEVRYGSMGVAAPGVDLAIVSDEGDLLENGQIGNIALRSPNPQLMLGYWNEPERTEAAFVSGRQGRWFVTGDLGHRDADGYFWYHSRADDVVNSSGYRIGPVEVESALLEHDAVLEAAVVGVPDAERGQVVKAFVVLVEGRQATGDLTRELQSHVKRVTAPYKYPRQIEYMESLPKGPTGKILRRALRERDANDGR